jgi:putative ABC transport system permease protein
MSDAQFTEIYGDVPPMQVNIDVEPDSLEDFEAWLTGYTENEAPNLSFVSRNTLKGEFEGLRNMYLGVGGTLAFVLALIGVLNFVNTMTASIYARRREFAMLQSVGMTGGQMKRTLIFEGAQYIALTLIFTLTAGAGIGLMITRVIAGQTWLFKESFTVLPSVICAIPLFAICAVAPLACYKKLARESLIERLRVE